MLHCFVSKWLLAVSWNEVFPKWTKFQGTEDKKNWRHWKLFPKVHSCSREILLRWPLLVSCKYTGMLETKSFWEHHSYTSFVRPFCIVPQPFKFTIVQRTVRPSAGERAWPYEPTSNWHGALYEGPRNESWAEIPVQFCILFSVRCYETTVHSGLQRKGAQSGRELFEWTGLKGLIKITKLSTMTRVLRVSRRWCFQVEVFWVVTPCSVLVVYRRFNGVITQKTSVSVMIVGDVAEIRIAYLTSTNCCHNFMHYLHSLYLINKCITSSDRFL
jgi:hypothetical protein